MIEITINKPFDLKSTLECGQAFRYIQESDDSYTVILKDRVINVLLKDNVLQVTSSNYDDLENIVINYFDLNRDYEAINEFIKNSDSKMIDIVDSCTGFKNLNQDPFEVIISFMISINNGVSSISKSINLIAERFGTELEFNGKTYYLFPDSNMLKDVAASDLRECKLGFRDINVYEYIQKVNNGEEDINKYFNLSSNDAMIEFQKNRGIGPKVASCVLMMGYGKLDVFPIDVWVKRAFKYIYDTDNVNEITNITNDLFKEYSGIAIQYMFHYMRNIKEEV